MKKKNVCVDDLWVSAPAAEVFNGVFGTRGSRSGKDGRSFSISWAFVLYRVRSFLPSFLPDSHLPDSASLLSDILWKWAKALRTQTHEWARGVAFSPVGRGLAWLGAARVVKLGAVTVWIIVKTLDWNEGKRISSIFFGRQQQRIYLRTRNAT